MTDRVTDSLDRPGSDSQVTRCQFSSKSRTDGRTDGLTKKNSPNDESSPNATPAGGLKESPIPDERQATRQLLKDAPTPAVGSAAPIKETA